MDHDHDEIALRKYQLHDLESSVYNALIVGVLIGKQTPRKLDGNRAGSNGATDSTARNADRAVWNFTFRDALPDYVNVTVWGTVAYVFGLHESLKVGDVVELQKPRITVRHSDDYGEQFRPVVTSPFHLTISEHMSSVNRYAGTDYQKYEAIAHYPTKPPVQIVALADIQNNIAAWKGDYVDIMVVVQHNGVARSITMKDHTVKEVRDVVVFDRTNSNFSITFWDSEYINRAEEWKVRETVLFMADVKVMYNDFRKCPTVSINMKSIITENPICDETRALQAFAVNAPIEQTALLTDMSSTMPHPSTIKTVLNIEQVQRKIDRIQSSHEVSTEEERFTALVYAVVTGLDLDGLQRVTLTKCKKCRTYIDNIKRNCPNTDCPDSVNDNAEKESMFDIKVMIADHTGCLDKCRLVGRTAELILNCNIDRFLEMSAEDRANLKWQYLMERCTLRLAIWCRSGRSPLISIVGCEIADPLEVAAHLPQ